MSYLTTGAIYADKLSRINTATCAPSILSAYIADAEAVVNGYIAKQYSVSQLQALTITPALLSYVTKERTICMVLSDGYTSDNQNLNDWLEKKYERNEKMLQDIADDNIRLIETTSTADITQEVNISMGSSLKGKPLTFNMDDAMDWKVPSNLLDAISTGRDAAE